MVKTKGNREIQTSSKLPKLWVNYIEGDNDELANILPLIKPRLHVEHLGLSECLRFACDLFTGPWLSPKSAVEYKRSKAVTEYLTRGRKYPLQTVAMMAAN